MSVETPLRSEDRTEPADRRARGESREREPREAPASPGDSPGYRRYFLTLILLVMAFSTVDRYVVSILADDLKRDLGLSDRQLGWILGPSFTLVYSAAVLPIARLADRSVRRTIIAAGLFAWSLFTVATAWVQSFAQLFALRMAVGIGEATASPASQSLISDSVPPERRARGLSVISIGAVAGLALGMAGGGWASEYFGWRAALAIAGLPGIALAILFQLTVREPVRGASERGAASAQAASSWLADCRYLFSLPAFRWMIVGHAFALFFSIGKNSWEPSFLRRVYELGPAAAGTWYFLITPVPSALGIFFGGWLSDRWSRRDPRARMWVPALTQLACIPALYAFFVWPTDRVLALPFGLPELPVAFVWSAVGSVIGAGFTAPFLSSVQDLAPLRMRATAAAVLSLSGSGLGSALGPLAVGELNTWLEPRYGAEAIRWALVAILAAPVLCALTCLRAAKSLGADLARTRAENARGAA